MNILSASLFSNNSKMYFSAAKRKKGEVIIQKELEDKIKKHYCTGDYCTGGIPTTLSPTLSPTSSLITSVLAGDRPQHISDIAGGVAALSQEGYEAYIRETLKELHKQEKSASTKVNAQNKK